MTTKPVVYMDITDLVKDLDEISELRPEQITENIFKDLGPEIVQKAKEKAPVDTGELKDSITHEVTGTSLTITVGAAHGLYQEFGTASRGEFPGQPYEIKPKKGKYLKFKVGDKTVFAKKVKHPGVAPQPFLRPAFMDTLGDLYGKLAERGQAMILKGPRSSL